MNLLEDLVTPYLVVDIDVLDRNVQAMSTLARERSIGLRPHVKTHKCREVARRQVAAGATGITVATISEAEIFAEAGFTEILIAYPLWTTRSRGARLQALSERCSLLVGVDSVEGAEAMARSTRHEGLSVLVEVDCGQHRTGVAPDAVASVAVSAQSAGLVVRGAFTYPGHGYGPRMAAVAAADEARALEIAAELMQESGAGVDILSGGSTPTAALTHGGVLTDIRPGVYVFCDAQQVELGTCAFDDVALTAAATVVSKAANRVVVDAGSKVLGADRQPWASGFGRVSEDEEAKVIGLSEHHGIVEWPEGSPTPELGAVLHLIPNHVCTAVNLADELIVSERGVEVDRWLVIARGANG